MPGADGGFGEIGAAQYFQALAARAAPGVDMNPVLLKPERDTASQVVVHGRVDAALSRLPWRERSDQLAVAARDSFLRLAARHELVVVEGAGSPAEINLPAHDYVNLGAARWARDAGGLASLLVADIDRGGAFAHLLRHLGAAARRPARRAARASSSTASAATRRCSSPARGSWSGSPACRWPACCRCAATTACPRRTACTTTPPAAPAPAHVRWRVAVLAAPHVSNLDEFQPLRQVPGLRLSWARSPADLDRADWIVLPGSKQVSGDLAWLRAQGLDAAVRRHAAAGGAVLGICGGLQMLGRSLDDPAGLDGEPHGPVPGLGLLPLATRYRDAKRVRPAAVAFAGAHGAWATLDGARLDAYEIRHGECAPADGAEGCAAVLRDAAGAPLGWQAGPVLGVHVHGLFESQAVLRALFGAAAPSLDAVFDRLAGLLDDHLDAGLLRRLLLAAPAR